MTPPASAAAATIDDVLRAQGLSGAEDPAGHCRKLATGHYENFPVLSVAVAPRLRPAYAAVYAFCRTVDDLGDEAQGDRRALLDAWEEDLLQVWDGAPRHPVHRALAPVVRSHGLEPEPFRRLVRANRMDQARTRWDTFEELREYCRHSADPVGRLVLALHGHRDELRRRLSDATCTALQLANFWQDVARDLKERGRIYLPREDLERFKVPESDLSAPSASPALRELVRFECARTRTLFNEGLPLAGRLEGRARWAVSAFSAGGLAVLDALEAQGFDPLVRRPALSGIGKLKLLARTGLRLLFGRREA